MRLYRVDFFIQSLLRAPAGQWVTAGAFALVMSLAVHLDYPYFMPNLLQDWLRAQYPQAKQNTLRQMLQTSRVRVNGQIARKMNQPIRETDRIEVTDRPKKPKPAPPGIHPLELVFEDDHLMVVYKPPGLLTSTVPRETRPTALAILGRYLDDTAPRARLGLVHRLDRDASGLLVFAKSMNAYASLKEQFFKHDVRREYMAITRGAPTPPAGRIESMLVETADGSVRSTKRPGGGQRAVTDYKTLARENNLAAVRVTLHTGRKHQIRAHLHERGVPILGDPMYGPQDQTKQLMLAAVLLGFEHPATGEQVAFEIAVPKQFPILGGKKLSELDDLTIPKEPVESDKEESDSSPQTGF